MMNEIALNCVSVEKMGEGYGESIEVRVHMMDYCQLVTFEFDNKLDMFE